MGRKGEAHGTEATYLGVAGYGAGQNWDRDQLMHRFWQAGGERVYSIRNSDDGYPIQNLLMEGGRYWIITTGGELWEAEELRPTAVGTVTALGRNTVTLDSGAFSLASVVRMEETIVCPGSTCVRPAKVCVGDRVKLYGRPVSCIEVSPGLEISPMPVPYIPGLRTLKNLLAAALAPVGTTLYVYGGGWNWQDDGAALQTREIGLPESWSAFFARRGADYAYRRQDGRPDWYPRGNYNQYYFAGADCSGYLGWTLYQIMCTQPGGEGFVCPAEGMARRLAEYWGLGKWDRPTGKQGKFCPGDIVSIRGHVWLCLGACEDGSLVILHSTPSPSRMGCPGGGVQLSGLGQGPGCQAAALARTCMRKYCPAWSQRYEAVWKPFAAYTAWEGADAGRFRWNPGPAGLGDPEEYRDRSAEAILEDLYDGQGDFE